jgi:hypothetical protein
MANDWKRFLNWTRTMNFKRRSVKVKLSVAFGGLAVVVLIVSGMSLAALNDANWRQRTG